MRNEGEPLYLTKILSACIDMDDNDFELFTLHGSWARERQIERRSIGYGRQSVGSQRGESSHQEHPFIAWMEAGADQTRGEVYGMHFVYSGNFIARIEKTQHDTIRAVMGIHPENFCWKLEKGDSFQAPEAILILTRKSFCRLQGGHRNWALKCWLWTTAGSGTGRMTIQALAIGL